MAYWFRHDSAERQAIYYPGPADEWERRAPAQLGLDARLLDEAIAFAKASETKGPRDLEVAHYESFGREPFGQLVTGPASRPAGVFGACSSLVDRRRAAAGRTVPAVFG